MFAMDEIMAECGREEMNKKLIRVIEEREPDLLFCFLFTDEIKPETIGHITTKTSTKTFNWFADDHWRFPIYSRHWAPLFSAASTTDSRAVEKYKSIGIKVIKTQWAANTLMYRSKSSGQNYNISFIGKNYGSRGQTIRFLQRQGLPATGYGKDFDGGVISQENMLEIFSGSKINLNFTESYFSWPKQLAKLFVRKESGKYRPNIQHLLSNIQSFMGARRPQIKGRTFEVPACGGFLLTGGADNLGDYYVDGKEIAIFKDKDDLVEKCKYYLTHETERIAIANAGYQRTLKDHTYEKRFTEIFKAMGFSV